MWTKLEINGYEIMMKHFDEPSDYGINCGKISKLSIRKNGEWMLNYDRGWDLKPTDADTKAIFEKLLKQYN